MILPPPQPPRTDTLFADAPLCRSKSFASTMAATTRCCSAKRSTARSECCDGGEKPLPSDPEGAVEDGDGESGGFRDDVVRPRALDHHAGRPVEIGRASCRERVCQYV